MSLKIHTDYVQLKKKKDFWIYILFDSGLEYHTVNKISVKVNLSIVVRFIKIVAHLQPFCDY